MAESLNDRANAAAGRAAAHADAQNAARTIGQSLNDRANAAAGRAAAHADAQNAARTIGQSLNDRASEAAGRAAADRDALNAWDTILQRNYARQIEQNGGLSSPDMLPPDAPGAKGPAVSRLRRTQGARWSTGNRDAAYAEYADILTKYGFERGDIMGWLKGLDYSTLQSSALVAQAFRGTTMWQQRFGAVTKAREKNGMSYINEGQIIALEDSYRQIFTAAGLPEQYWERSDLQDLIANDVSPQEVADRVSLAEDAINNTDPQYVRAFRDFYGIKKKDLVGYMLNREKGVQLLQEQVAAAEIGAEARGSGMDHVGRKFAEKLVDKDISRQEARQAFGSVADTEKDWRKLAKLSGERISEKSLVKDELGLDKKGRITRKKKRLASEERARFGNSGGGTGAMGTSTSGAY